MEVVYPVLQKQNKRFLEFWTKSLFTDSKTI